MKLIFAMLLMFSGYTFASCSNISDSDQRNYCQATQEGSTCSSIRDSDLRASCEAEKGSTCSSIRDSDQRAYCEAKKCSTCSSIRDSDLRATCEAEKGSICSSTHVHFVKRRRAALVRVTGIRTCAISVKP